MGQHVVVPGGADLPARLSLAVGDTAEFWASGAEVQAGADVVGLGGARLRTAAHDAGAPPHPAGLPNTVQVVAQRAGTAVLQLFIGATMLGQQPRKHLVHVTVHEAPAQ